MSLGYELRKIKLGKSFDIGMHLQVKSAGHVYG